MSSGQTAVWILEAWLSRVEIRPVSSLLCLDLCVHSWRRSKGILMGELQILTLPLIEVLLKALILKFPQRD